MILELEHVFKDYAQGKTPVPVLRDISMKVEEGEYLAIMGPSGSGKTTLMNVLGCLDVPTSGRYVLEGQDIGTLGDEALAHVRNKTIGFVFQNFHLLPTMTAKENVMLPLAYRGLPVKDRKLRAEAALKLMGLGDRADFYPNQLSGGQCQRVAIARAIAGNPRLILADEPTGALDTAAGEQIMEIFRRLSQRGITIIMITHEPHIARCADRILRIRDGRLVEDADTAQKEVALT